MRCRSTRLPHVAETPKLNCIVTDLKNGDGTLCGAALLADRSFADRPVSSNSLVRTRVYTALRRAGIQAFDACAIGEVITEEKLLRDRQNNEEFDRRIAALQRIELFHALTEEERQDLAAQLIYAPFAHGEAITRQDAVANWLYVMTEGEAEVRVAVSGLNRVVGTLRAGDYFFGEMGLTDRRAAERDAQSWR